MGSDDSFTFTVGKLDAGMAILLGERAHLIEFPSILLPPGATTGSIVNIQVNQNVAEEKRRDKDFWELQDSILETYGVKGPEPPLLKLCNATQTSITLEWTPLVLATAKLRSLDIYRDGQRLLTVPNPTSINSSKVSSLQLDTEYNFYIVLRTTAGTFTSNTISARTHTMIDTSGIRVCFGTVDDEQLLENAKAALAAMKAKYSDKTQVETTHFVCTSPGGSFTHPSVEYQRALQLSLPIVQPQWILACHSEKKMVQTAQYYLGVPTPSTPLTSITGRPQSMSQISMQQQQQQPSPASHRQSLPPPARSEPPPPPTPSSSFVGQTTTTNDAAPTLEPTPEEDDDLEDQVPPVRTSTADKRRSRPGTMDRNFKFPPSSPTLENASPGSKLKNETSSVEIPPPPPNQKEKKVVSVDDRFIDDVGETEEISLA